MHRLAPFRWTAFIVLALALVLEVVNGRFWLNDLKVYVMAADALRHGQPVYGLPFGLDTGYYKYAPGVLYFFLPYTLLPYSIACVLHFALIAAALVSVFHRLERLLVRHVFLVHPPRMVLRAFIGFVCIAVHGVRELHMGNVNLLLLWCVVVAIEALLDERTTTAGVLFGLAILVKPYLLLCALPIVLLRQWSALRTVMLTIVAGGALPLLIEGPREGLSLTMAWVDAMRAHGGYLTSANTLRSLASTATGTVLPGWTDLLFAVLAAALVTGVTLVKARTDRKDALFLGVSLALAFVPLLVITDVQHFLLALPLIMWTLAQLQLRSQVLWTGLFTLAMLAYGTDSTDLWGRELAAELERIGLVGWGALGLVLIAAGMALPKGQNPAYPGQD